ncbi:hypothetical protein [Candidatus Phytoplasma pruni]|uniref:Uncharacterized protein n=1 Tax=Candidatus Phytoplasma pruni TaxID=479893 RepID=A0A851H9Z5_9MOLU|nr:hypothetical protein [Candidatus Phytoplasma pruni]NWN45707.1 hypothetical protein [Candidatus Phytoplasma pruni]
MTNNQPTPSPQSNQTIQQTKKPLRHIKGFFTLILVILIQYFAYNLFKNLYQEFYPTITLDKMKNLNFSLNHFLQIMLFTYFQYHLTKYYLKNINSHMLTKRTRRLAQKQYYEEMMTLFKQDEQFKQNVIAQAERDLTAQIKQDDALSKVEVLKPALYLQTKNEIHSATKQLETEIANTKKENEQLKHQLAQYKQNKNS